MAKSLAPVDVRDFRLTIPLPCPTGKPLRVAMAGADRPWCPAMHVPYATGSYQAKWGAKGKLGGRVGDRYVRDIGETSAETELMAAMASTLPDARRIAWMEALGNVSRRSHYGGRVLILGKMLDPYQIESANAVTAAGSVMALSVGLGKTLISLAAADLLAVDAFVNWGNGVSPHIMVVCPLNAMPVWQDPEIRKYYVGKGWTYTVMSADSLHKVQSLQNNGPAVLIVDEAHYFGNWSAQRTKLIHKLRWQFDACLPLTGSMLHAGPEKVLSLLDLACPGAALYGNIYEFGEAFECLYSKDIGGGVMKKAVGRPPARLQDAWQKYLDRFVVAKTKRSPDVMVSCYIPEQQIHDVDLFDPNGPSMLDEAAACAKEIFDTEKRIPAMIEVVHRLARQGIDEKLDWLGSMMSGFTEQAVLFATYHETLNAIQEWLDQSGMTFCRIDGAVTGTQRTTLIDDFRAGKYQTMLAQTDAASVSMNLQTARISVMLDTTQKAANFEQALGRTCRRGSTDLCHHFNLAGNRFQRFVFNRLKNAMDFNASVAEWQDAKRAIEQTLPQGTTP